MKRQLSLPVSMMSQWWVKRSSSAVVILGSRESCVAIDVGEWKRRGLLRPGQMFPVSWNRSGVSCGSISVRTETDAVVLIFRSQRPGETEWKSTEQRVPILWTACHLGGRRPWFRCPVYLNGQYCGRRVAVLYAAGDLFACRHCYGLVQPAPSALPYRNHLTER